MLSDPPKPQTSLVQKKALGPKAGFEPAGKAEIGTTWSQWAVGAEGAQGQARRGGGCRHLARLRKFHSLSRAGRYRMWARRETLRDLRPSIASSCPPLPPQGRPRTRRGLLGQDPGPRTQCQDLALEPKPSSGSSHPHRSQDCHSVAELCLWSYPLLKITHWKVRGPLSLNGLGPGRGD